MHQRVHAHPGQLCAHAWWVWKALGTSACIRSTGPIRACERGLRGVWDGKCRVSLRVWVCMLLAPAGASAARSAVRTRMVGLEGCGGSLPASGAQGQFGACERVLGGLWCGGYCSAFGAVHCPQHGGGKPGHPRQLPGHMRWAHTLWTKRQGKCVASCDDSDGRISAVRVTPPGRRLRST